MLLKWLLTVLSKFFVPKFMFALKSTDDSKFKS